MRTSSCSHRCGPLELVRITGAALLLAGLVAGCAHIPNYYADDSPSRRVSLDSPTALDVRTRFEPAQSKSRDWESKPIAASGGSVVHGPLWMEDPFVDKGHGRRDYRLGWEDWVGMPYGYARYTLNWLMLPVSTVVTPPWTPMESDGELSRQALGYDHDAARVGAEAPPASIIEQLGAGDERAQQSAAGSAAPATTPVAPPG